MSYAEFLDDILVESRDRYRALPPGIDRQKVLVAAKERILHHFNTIKGWEQVGSAAEIEPIVLQYIVGTATLIATEWKLKGLWVDLQAPAAVQSTWSARYPPREWIVDDWLPAGVLALFTGAGGSGKSLLALQLAVCLALGEQNWLPTHPMATCPGVPQTNLGGPVPVQYASWEDNIPEATRRIHRLLGEDLEVAGWLDRWLWFTEEDRLLWSPSKEPDAPGNPTTRLAGLLDFAADKKMLVLDTAALAFGGNENNRTQVSAFLVYLSQWAASTDTTVLLVAHPAKPTATYKPVYSGSSAWMNSPRVVWSLTKTKIAQDDITREAPTLTLEKSNFGPAAPVVEPVYMCGTPTQWLATNLELAAR